MKEFEAILRDIKSVKIQGAENIAIAGLKAYSLKPNIKQILKTRPTEPALRNALNYAKKQGVKSSLYHFKVSKEIIKHIGVKKVKKVVFTHCHSSSVIDVLKQAKKSRNFQVYNTETRPLFQGRKTSKELAEAKIKVTELVDSAALLALTKNSFFKKSNVVFLGADAILKDGSVINKVGSGMIAELAKHNKVPVYIITDSWKFSNKPVSIEERSFKEVWKKAPKHVKIKNPAFERIPEKNITGIISELGILKPKKFVKKVKKVYKWI